MSDSGTDRIFDHSDQCNIKRPAYFQSTEISFPLPNLAV